MSALASELTEELDTIAAAIEYVPGFQVRERATGRIRTITNVEMMALMHEGRRAFDRETLNETTCCGGAISSCGYCSRFPGRKCIYLGEALALLQGVG